MLGGSSAMNAMIYIRGNAADFDGWVNEDAPGWSLWENLAPAPVTARADEYGFCGRRCGQQKNVESRH